MSIVKNTSKRLYNLRVRGSNNRIFRTSLTTGLNKINDDSWYSLKESDYVKKLIKDGILVEVEEVTEEEEATISERTTSHANPSGMKKSDVADSPKVAKRTTKVK